MYFFTSVIKLFGHIEGEKHLRAFVLIDQEYIIELTKRKYFSKTLN